MATARHRKQLHPWLAERQDFGANALLVFVVALVVAFLITLANLENVSRYSQYPFQQPGHSALYDLAR